MNSRQIAEKIKSRHNVKNIMENENAIGEGYTVQSSGMSFIVWKQETSEDGFEVFRYKIVPSYFGLSVIDLKKILDAQPWIPWHTCHRR